MFGLLNNIKELALTATIVFGLGASLGWWKQKQETDRIANNMYRKEIKWEDERGRLVTETTELRFTVEEMEAASRRDSTNLSDVEKLLREASDELEALRVDKDKVVQYHKAEIAALHKDLETNFKIVDNTLTEIEPIRTKHLNIDFEIKDDKILADAEYKTDMVTIVDRDRDKFTKSGKKRFFLARWISPRWKYSSKTVVDDPNAEINNAVTINFDNRK